MMQLSKKLNKNQASTALINVENLVADLNAIS